MRDAFLVYNPNEVRNSIEDACENAQSHFDELELGDEFAQPEDLPFYPEETVEVILTILRF